MNQAERKQAIATARDFLRNRSGYYADILATKTVVERALEAMEAASRAEVELEAKQKDIDTAQATLAGLHVETQSLRKENAQLAQQIMDRKAERQRLNEEIAGLAERERKVAEREKKSSEREAAFTAAQKLVAGGAA